MSLKPTVRLVLVILFMIALSSPPAASAAPLRREFSIGDLFGAVRQWIGVLWSQPALTKHGCGIDPWGQPIPCPPATTKAGCGIDPWGNPICQ